MAESSDTRPSQFGSYRIAAKRHRCCVRWCWLILCLLFTPLAVAQSPKSAALQTQLNSQFEKDYAAITAPENRTIGSPGYRQTQQYLETQIRSLPNVELKVQDFEVMVPVTNGPATLAIAGGTTAQVYPFWPAHIRVNATPDDGIRGRLVYIGKAGFDEIDPDALRGQIAVIEAQAREMWSQGPYFGAQAVIVLGSPETTNQDLAPQELVVPVAIPRFYLPDGTLADQLRRGEVVQPALLKAKVNWEPRTARNYYAFVPGTTQRPNGWTGNLNSGVLMFSAGYESSALVPDLAKGASQAVQTAAALNLLRDFAARPTERPVMVFFGGGDSIAQLATRTMFMAFSDVPKVWRDEMAQSDGLTEQMRLIARDLQRIREFASNLSSINPDDDRDQIDRVVKLIETDMALEQDQLFRLRVTQEGSLSPEQKRQRDVLEQRQIKLSRLKFAFQTHPQRLVNTDASDPDQPLASDATEYVRRTIERLEQQQAHYQKREAQLLERIELYQWLAGRLKAQKQDADAYSAFGGTDAESGAHLSPFTLHPSPLSMINSR